MNERTTERKLSGGLGETVLSVSAGRSPARMRWEKFVAHRHGFISLVLLGLIYAASLISGFFLKSDVISDDTLEHRRRIVLRVRPENPVVRLDVDSENRIVWREGDCAYFGLEGVAVWNPKAVFPNPAAPRILRPPN